MGTDADRFATPRMAAGALFVDDQDRVLLVHKTYGNGWDIPGGYVDVGESPAAACRRELREELGLDREPQRLLAVDWAPNEGEGDKVLWVFDCGLLGEDEHRIKLDDSELDRWEWVPVTDLGEYLVPRLARRLNQSHAAASRGDTAYLEHGHLPGVRGSAPLSTD
ncbi:NUDIX domain-containing protein [Saccharothrix algeriensis]|uniref:8-oxo-dGTP pyrophosphatase MutT (NUDIX family) n=1 Tax=Saccharothrix algeriensis TaxID=173560 RepID=A0ABS2SDK3_9PSEU|nr:NUDIX hydrolase [Saccharothrix algeriensis]MBM7813704.1 8-oxo-dGTP pyrophosphatase MutT (NUDIX family) [Saccharothrix algeriensis]